MVVILPRSPSLCMTQFYCLSTLSRIQFYAYSFKLYILHAFLHTFPLCIVLFSRNLRRLNALPSSIFVLLVEEVLGEVLGGDRVAEWWSCFRVVVSLNTCIESPTLSRSRMAFRGWEALIREYSAAGTL